MCAQRTTSPPSTASPPIAIRASTRALEPVVLPARQGRGSGDRGGHVAVGRRAGAAGLRRGQVLLVLERDGRAGERLLQRQQRVGGGPELPRGGQEPAAVVIERRRQGEPEPAFATQPDDADLSDGRRRASSTPSPSARRRRPRCPSRGAAPRWRRSSARSASPAPARRRSGADGRRRPRAPSSRRTRASTVRSDDRGAEPNVITNCLAERFSSRTRVNPFCRVTETRIGSPPTARDVRSVIRAPSTREPGENPCQTMPAWRRPGSDREPKTGTALVAGAGTTKRKSPRPLMVMCWTTTTETGEPSCASPARTASTFASVPGTRISPGSAESCGPPASGGGAGPGCWARRG